MTASKVTKARLIDGRVHVKRAGEDAYAPATSRTNWSRLAMITDEEAERQAIEDDSALTDEELANGVSVVPGKDEAAAG